jgi:hypothetical protein
MGFYGANDRSEVALGICSLERGFLWYTCIECCDSRRRLQNGDDCSPSYGWLGAFEGSIWEQAGSGPLQVLKSHVRMDPDDDELMRHSDQQRVTDQMQNLLPCPCAWAPVPQASSAHQCATEGAYCRCAGAVRYGYGYGAEGEDWKARTKWVETGTGIQCTNDGFGRDPAAGEVKACDCLPGVGVYALNVTANGAGVHICAGEDQSCNCDGLVRYGDPNDGVLFWSPWELATPSVPTPCTNDHFSDTAPGEVKSCQCMPVDAATTDSNPFGAYRDDPELRPYVIEHRATRSDPSTDVFGVIPASCAAPNCYSVELDCASCPSCCADASGRPAPGPGAPLVRASPDVLRPPTRDCVYWTDFDEGSKFILASEIPGTLVAQLLWAALACVALPCVAFIVREGKECRSLFGCSREPGGSFDLRRPAGPADHFGANGHSDGPSESSDGGGPTHSPPPQAAEVATVMATPVVLTPAEANAGRLLGAAVPIVQAEAVVVQVEAALLGPRP